MTTACCRLAWVLTAAGGLIQAACFTTARAHDGHESPGGSQVQIEVRDGFRYIKSNGLPDHLPGRFPTRGNPNTIRAQQHHWRVPLEPQAGPRPTPLGHHPFGVALNGVPFDPGAAEFWQGNPRSGWQYEALSGKINLGLDAHHAHVQPNGAYHYHGLPTGLVERLHGRDQVTLLGYAADGFPIYGPFGFRKKGEQTSSELKSSYRVRAGQRPDGPGGDYDGTFVQDWEYLAGSGDLDEFNGRTGVTPEYPQGTYYYVITSDYPFIPRQFRGTPDASFLRQGPRGFGPPPKRKKR